VRSPPLSSSHVERDSSSVALRAHGEVYPVGRAALLQEQFVPVAPRAVGDVEQDGRIAYHLLRAHTADVGGTARQVVARARAATPLIDLLRAIRAVNNHRDVAAFTPPPTGTIMPFNPPPTGTIMPFNPPPTGGVRGGHICGNGVMGGHPLPIQPIVQVAQILQPVLTEVLQVLDGHPRRDVAVLRVITRLRHLAERKVWR